GGKSFSTLISYNIHLDHHAWWINPADPSFMIDGNDGGLAITHDKGKSWRHVTNLPVSQFYHIAVDMELPYNIYGGMQDNGSWKGPGYTWSGGGIINTYWDFLMGGDGFDVLPVPEDARYCYAMSQQGNVRRVDLETGGQVNIKPAKTGEEELRFNWNAAIAQDPFQKDVVYFGSQFVHKSADRGDSWQIISPDLTTNDTAKQKFNESGGLTYDVTGAENHTCILAIAPSPVETGVIWVGTDDGNIQLSTDGGDNWENCSPRIKDFPEGAWVPQIVPSSTKGGEAFVVVNNYRLNDYSPYLYYTSDYGKKWERVIDSSDVPGYVLSFAQDPKEPKLQFLGTEYGLYVSIDGGAEWNKWTNGFPTVSTMDLVIHPREEDLVIGTFGRSAFILDDIRPLRALAADYEEVTSASLYALETPEAYLADFRNAPGYYFTGDAYFEGENRSYGGRISYFVSVEDSVDAAKKDSVVIEILDGDNKLIRTLKSVPENGLNRTNWRLDRKGVRLSFSAKKPKSGGNEPRGGGSVLPGNYQLRLSYKGDTTLSTIEVKADPRTPYDMEGMKLKQETADQLLAKMEELNSGLTEIRECREGFTLVEKLLGKEQSENLKSISKAMEEQLSKLEKELFMDEKIQGIYYPSDALYVKFSGTYSILGSRRPLTENNLDKYKGLISLADETLARIDTFLEEQWAEYREAVLEEDISLLKD
ncbi:MAG: hypothetical protein QNK35_06450, partial [Bacteroides sp.]|nr:hypothetical protein [Bacteroides sp.]